MYKKFEEDEVPNAPPIQQHEPFENIPAPSVLTPAK